MIECLIISDFYNSFNHPIIRNPFIKILPHTAGFCSGAPKKRLTVFVSFGQVRAGVSRGKKQQE